MISSKSFSNKSDTEMYENYYAVDDFVEAFSGQTCQFASLPILSKLGKLEKTGSIAGKIVDVISLKVPCKLVLTQVMHPIASVLRDKALLQDMEVVTFSLEEQVRTSIVNLATAKDDYRFRVSETNRRDLWKFRSETTLSANAIASVIAGFDLNEHFDISVSPLEKSILIELPMPTVLSNSVNIYFADVDEGLIAPSASSEMYNILQEKAQQKAREYAEDLALHEAAISNARKVVLAIFRPVMSMPQFDYTVQVVFVDRFGERVDTAVIGTLQ